MYKKRTAAYAAAGPAGTCGSLEFADCVLENLLTKGSCRELKSLLGKRFMNKDLRFNNINSRRKEALDFS